MRIVSIIVASMVCTGCAHQDPWINEDTKHFMAYAVSASIDVYSTNRLLDGYYFAEERNPVIIRTFGVRPTKNQLIIGTLVIGTLNYFIAKALPEKYRHKYLDIWTFGHSALALNNHRLYNRFDGFKITNPIQTPPPGRIIM